MLEEIVEIHNLIPEEYTEKLHTYATETANWRLHRSNPEFKERQFLQMDLTDNAINRSIVSMLEEKLNKKFFLRRSYFNGQFFGTPSGPHIDDTEENEYTFLAYINLNWNVLWGGQTIFFDKSFDKKTKQMITHSEKYKVFYPDKNLSLFFPATILHYAECPTKHCPALRISLALKLKEIK